MKTLHEYAVFSCKVFMKTLHEYADKWAFLVEYTYILTGKVCFY